MTWTDAEKFRALADEASDAIFIAGTDGRFQYVNLSSCRMLGYSRDELLRLNMTELVTPDELLRSPLRTAELLAGKSLLSERTLRRKDGTLLNAEFSSKMLPDGSLQALVRDVTERHRQDHERREIEARYRQIFETNRAIKLLLDPLSGAIADANQAACAYYGYSKAEMLALKITDINTLAPAEVQAEMDAAVREQRLYFRFRHRLRSGEIRDVEVYSGPVDVQGRKLLFSIVHDITARSEAERAVRLREEYYRALIDNAPDIISVVSAEGIIRYQSPAIERVLGYGADELNGTDLFALFHPKDQAFARKAFQHISKTPGILSPIELRCRHKSGAWRTLEIWGNNLLDNAAVEGLVFNSRDITERKKIIDDLRERTDELERLNRIMVDREIRMVDLKAELARLRAAAKT